MSIVLDDQEYSKIIRNFRLAGLITLITLSIGSVFYHIVEKLSWLDALYLSVITLATVGYGDITPQTALGKIFTIFYVLAGIGIIATFANLFLKRAMIRREHNSKTKK